MQNSTSNIETTVHQGTLPTPTGILGCGVLRDIREQTALNDHCEAYRLAAVALGLHDLAEQFADIRRKKMARGFLPFDLYEQRHGLYLSLMEQAKTLLDKNYFRALHSSF